jgi:DtxR family Mn-dependent transcriptional regulator
MAKRLAKAGLVRRAPYRGLTLTEEGRKAALGVVRRHRLVELYLVKVLGYSWDEVHEEVESLEHAVSEEFVDRIDRLLGHPEVDAHGSPIPTKDGEVVEPPYVPLAGIGGGERVALRRVLDRDPEVPRHLAGMGLILGAELEVVERHPFDEPLILDAGGESRVVSPKLAGHVFVEPVLVRREAGAGRMILPCRAILTEGSR